MELLEFHKSSTILEVKAFFEHYYKNQWYVCVHRDDEKVLDIVMENLNSSSTTNRNGKNGDEEEQVVHHVVGKEYTIDGILLYHGDYRHHLYHGHGIIFYENSSYSEGQFVKGEREGIHIIRNGHGILEEGEYKKGKAVGEHKEYYFSGNTTTPGAIRNIYHYEDGKKEGLAQWRDGKGGLLWIGMYSDNEQQGKCCEFVSPHFCKVGVYDDNYDNNDANGKGNGKGNRRMSHYEWCYKETPLLSPEMGMDSFSFPSGYYSMDVKPLIDNENIEVPILLKKQGDKNGNRFLCKL